MKMNNKQTGPDATAVSLESLWNSLPDHLWLRIFKYIPARAVLDASQVCSRWHRIALDEMLWRDLFYQYFHINRSIPLAPGSTSWMSEFKRLSYHTPAVESEVIQQHRDEVLHISFAHNGKLFATTSKDGLVKVWNAVYPCTLKHEADMKKYTWMYTQHSQFNSNDTLLLVSGMILDSSYILGEIAVFSLDDQFELRHRVINKPFDVFGAWYTSNCLLSGNFFWLGDFLSSSVLYLNDVSQALESEQEPVVAYRFLNQNSDHIWAILVARCPLMTSEGNDQRRSYHSNISDSQSDSESSSVMEKSGRDDGRICQSLPERLSDECTESHTGAGVLKTSDSQPCFSVSGTTTTTDEEPDFVEDCHLSADGAAQVQCADDEFCDKYLIFAMGKETVIAHQIGIKRIAVPEMKDTIDRLKHLDLQLVPNSDLEPNIDKFDDIDHLIELHGRFIGMNLSPDHRFLYVNCRSWPKDYRITDPLSPPPIAEEIDIHVIDLVTLTEVGSPLRSHKAFSSNAECFFMDLDVSSQYIASGSEDCHGYMWDRHYGSCIRKFGHSNVVSGAAFNPRDPEVLVTVSDDYSIKIWRSRNRELEVKRSISSQKLE